MWNAISLVPGLKLVSPCPFLTTITITPRAPRFVYYALVIYGVAVLELYVVGISLFSMFPGIIHQDLIPGIIHQDLLFLIFVCNASRSSCVNCPCLMSSWLFIISCDSFIRNLMGFSKQILEMFFPQMYSFFWLTAFSLTLVVLFLLFTSLTVCCFIQNCLSSTKFLILLNSSCVYFDCSFMYGLFNSLYAFLRFWT